MDNINNLEWMSDESFDGNVCDTSNVCNVNVYVDELDERDKTQQYLMGRITLLLNTFKGISNEEIILKQNLIKESLC